MVRILVFLSTLVILSCSNETTLEDQVLADPLYKEFAQVQKDHMAFIAKGNLNVIKDEVVEVLGDFASPCNVAIEDLPSNTQGYFSSLCRSLELSRQLRSKYSSDSKVFEVHSFFESHSSEQIPSELLLK